MSKNNNGKWFGKTATIFLVIALLMLCFFTATQIGYVLGVPQGASITFNQTENASTRVAAAHTAAGGSFTTLLLNVSSQTSKWKAYVGNVTGKLTLDSSANKTIYDWSLSVMQGEVYVSRNNSVSFGNIACANNTNITTEETALNINSSNADSINSTFTNRMHRSFVIGGTGTIQNSTCYAISTYIDDAAQSASESSAFQEILLADGRSLVFITLLEDSVQGFDQSLYDFQIIVPDDPGAATTTYYFYAELG